MDIFIIKTNSAENIPDELLQKFNLKNRKNEKKRQIHALAYLMTDRILKNFYGINDAEIVFSDKKPMLKSGQKQFSISHSGEYIAIGFSDYVCGIDIEKMKDRDFKAISERMNFSSGSLLDFYKNWTTYEAEYKSGESAKSVKTLQYEDYMITAVSSSEENIELYFQTEKAFSKSSF